MLLIKEILDVFDDLYLEKTSTQSIKTGLASSASIDQTRIGTFPRKTAKRLESVWLFESETMWKCGLLNRYYIFLSSFIFFKMQLVSIQFVIVDVKLLKHPFFQIPKRNTKQFLT